MSNVSCLLYEQDGINQGPRQQRLALSLDQRILFALWLYAVLYLGGGEVARLARELDAYRWICGGVSVNNHALNDFRSGNEALMDEVLAANVAALTTAGGHQPGGTWRKPACGCEPARGAASFQRQVSLQQHLAEAG